jgi:hypothetical protein
MLGRKHAIEREREALILIPAAQLRLGGSRQRLRILKASIMSKRTRICNIPYMIMKASTPYNGDCKALKKE